MAWYRIGTVSLTNGSAAVTGLNTLWTTQCKAGDIFTLDEIRLYEVKSVDSDTQVTLTENYGGATASGLSYAIIPNFTNTTNADLAAKIAKLVNDRQTSVSEMIGWLSGTATGGQNSDGTYPITDFYGNTFNVKSAARFQADVDGAVTDAQNATAIADSASAGANDALTRAQAAIDDANTAKATSDTAAANANAAAALAATATSNANTAAGAANDAAAAANASKALADTATANADTATANADTATTNANTARDTANTAAGAANTAKANADTATGNANTATAAANQATSDANTARDSANAAASAANTAKANADTATSAANTATGNANTATSNANTATTNANNAAALANAAATNAQNQNFTTLSASTSVTSAEFDFAANAQYLYGKKADGTRTRLFGLSASNDLYIGGIDATINSIQFGAAPAVFGATVSLAAATASGHAVNLGQADGRYAALAGLSTQTFSVANATANTHAINLSQANSLYLGISAQAVDSAKLGGTVAANYALQSWVTGLNYITAAGAPVQSVAGRTGAVTLSNTDISGLGTAATAAASSFLGATAQAVDSAKLNGQLPSYYATAASVPLASSTSPNMDGAAAVGTGITWARADHVHPVDTSRLGVNATAANANALVGQGNIAPETGGTAGPSGLTLRGVYSNGYPTTYGNVLHMDANGGQGQLLIGWSGVSTSGNGVSADNFIRNLRDGHQAWSPWAKIWTDQNLTNLSQLSNGPGFITAGGAPVQSVAGRTGAVTLSASDVSGLAAVATSGAYSSLSGLPTIPTNNTQLTNGAGYQTSSGTVATAGNANALGNLAPAGYVTKPGGTGGQNGVQRLLRSDVGVDNFNVQSWWDGTYWQLKGYNDSTYHAGVRVALADNASAAGGLGVCTTTNQQANGLVRTDANGYIYSGWINTVSGDMGASAVGSGGRVYVSNDAFLRYKTMANFATEVATYLPPSGDQPGDIKATAASAAPSGWLICDGSAVSRSTYAALYAAIGTTFGAGDGSTTFNLPDGRGRTMIGAGQGSGLTSRALGATGGEEYHVQTQNELVDHGHGVNDPGHSHNPLAAVGSSTSNTVWNPSASHVINGLVNTSTATTSSSTGVSINGTGSGAGANVMQPFFVGNWIIKT